MASWSRRACWLPRPTTGTPPATAARVSSSTATRCCSACPGEPSSTGVSPRTPACSWPSGGSRRWAASTRPQAPCPATTICGTGRRASSWAQFRLNDREDDIEIVQPAAELRQEGYDQGPRFCTADVRWMNQTFTQAVPYAQGGAADGSQWVDVNHFDGGRVAALRYRFDPGAGVYRWTDTGPLVAGPGPWRHSEASIARAGSAWIIATRASAAERGGRSGHRLGPHRRPDLGRERSHPVPRSTDQQPAHPVPLSGRRPPAPQRRPACLALRLGSQPAVPLGHRPADPPSLRSARGLRLRRHRHPAA